MKAVLRLLLVEDSPLDAKLILHELKQAPFLFSYEQVDTPTALAEQLKQKDWDLIVSDYNLPHMDGLYVLKTVAACDHDIPVIIVSGNIGEDTAVATMQAGADDYVMKDNLKRLVPAISRAIRQAASRREKRRGEQDIQQAKGELEAFFNSSLQGIFLLNLQGIIQRLNPIAREYGLRVRGQEPQPGESILTYIPEEERASFVENLARCLQGEALVWEHPVSSAAGETRWYQTKFYPIYDGEKKISGVGYSSFDITNRKESEVEMQELRLRLEGIITSAMDAIITLDAAQKIVMFNRAAETMFGYGAEQVLNQPLNILLPYRYRTVHAQHVVGYGQSGRTTRQMGMNMTLSALRSDGVEFPIEASISQVEVAKKKYFTVILRDITLRIKAEEEEKKLHKELIQQNEQLQQFAYITSHNLRGPVASMMGLINLVERQQGLSQHNGMLVENMEKTIHKLDTVIRDLNTILEYKKGIHAIKEPLSLSLLSDEILQLLGKILEDAKARVEYDFGRQDQVFTVRTYLHSIFYNLISNAIKFRHPERPLLLRIRSWQDAAYLCISFEDNGLGMDLSKHKDSLFGLYKRFHQQVDGKGLGLHLVKTQAEALQGSVGVESTVGEGTTFILRLPIISPTDSMNPEEKPGMNTPSE